MDLVNTAKKRIEGLKKIAEEHGLFSSNINRKNYNFEFTLSQDTNNLKILVYFGKKGVKIVIQGNKNTSFYDHVANLFGVQESLFEQGQNDSFTPPREYIGSDESGKGDFFGPLVTAAFYTTPEISEELLAIGVKDSKTLSDNSINVIAAKIYTRFPSNFEVSILIPEEYNPIYAKIKNINTILSGEHSKVIQKLFDKVGKKEVIIDQFSVRTEPMKQQLGENINFITKAEKYPAVAAASILARSNFNNWFDNEPALSLELPKGASKQVEEHAAAIKRSLGLDIFGEISKLHFSTFNKIQ